MKTKPILKEIRATRGKSAMEAVGDLRKLCAIVRRPAKVARTTAVIRIAELENSVADHEVATLYGPPGKEDLL